MSSGFQKDRTPEASWRLIKQVGPAVERPGRREL